MYNLLSNIWNCYDCLVKDFRKVSIPVSKPSNTVKNCGVCKKTIDSMIIECHKCSNACYHAECVGILSPLMYNLVVDSWNCYDCQKNHPFFEELRMKPTSTNINEPNNNTILLNPDLSIKQFNEECLTFVEACVRSNIVLCRPLYVRLLSSTSFRLAKTLNRAPDLQMLFKIHLLITLKIVSSTITKIQKNMVISENNLQGHLSTPTLIWDPGGLFSIGIFLETNGNN